MRNTVEKRKNKIPLVLYICGSVLLGGIAGLLLRVLDVMAGRTLNTMVIFLGVAGLGLVLGALLAFSGGSGKSPHTALFCTIFLAAAGHLVFTMSALNGLSSTWQRMLLETSRTYDLYLITLLKTSAIFILFPALLAGAGYVVAFRSQARAFALSWSLCSALSLAAGWWLFSGFCIAAVGAGMTLRWLILLLGLTGAAVLVALRNPSRLLQGGAVLMGALAIGAWSLTAAFKVDGVLADGTFGRLVYRDTGFAYGKPVAQLSTLRHTAALYDDPDYQFVLALDGRPMLFGSRFHTARTLNAYVPLLIRPEAGRVLLSGAEAGFYAPFLVRAGVVDISYCGADRAVIQWAVNKDAELCGDASCRVENLKQGSFSDRYDLIYLTPEPVYMRGAAAYFSQRAFNRASEALHENGIVALHLDARGLSLRAFASVVGNMHSVFPYMQIWSTGAHDWVLVGSHTLITADAGAVVQMFERDQVFKDFARAGKLSIADGLASMVCDERGVEQWLEGRRSAPMWQLSWEAPTAVFNSRAQPVLPGVFETARQFDLKGWFLRGELEADVYESLVNRVIRNISSRMSAVIAVTQMSLQRSEEAMRDARAAAAINQQDALLVQLSESLELEARRRIKIGDFKGAIRCYENLLSLSEGSPQAHYGMGYCLRASNDVQGAYIHFVRAVVGAPEQSDYRLELAEAALAVAQYVVADKQYEKVLEANPEDAQTLFLFAKALARKDRPDKNYKRAIELAERACQLTQWDNLEIALGLADLYMDAGRVMEGMGLRRTLKAGAKPQLIF
ncbi:MAG: tetratricopeptide repeat protein [Kiritimatiellia bacterium]